jgi:hypothetical protein
MGNLGVVQCAAWGFFIGVSVLDYSASFQLMLLASIWHGIDVDEFGEDSLAEPVVEESVDYGAGLISWY